MDEDAARDWSQWSRECVQLMQARNRAFIDKFALSGRRFHWNLDVAKIVFAAAESAVIADLTAVGSTSESEGSFRWAWANAAIPRPAKERIEEVRRFGQTHRLDLLTEAQWPGGRAEALEMLAVAGRILDADGVLVAPDDDLTFFFALHRFRAQPLSTLPWLTGLSGQLE
jgi:hypothetical protein